MERARRSNSPEQQTQDDALAGSIDDSKARCKTLAGFVREAWHIVERQHAYKHGWHIEFLCEHLEAISRGELLQRGFQNRLLANVPPGTMKSLILNVFWPMWEWGPGGLPAMSYMCSSFKLTSCERDSDRCRQIVTSGWFQARWPIEMVRTSIGYLENAAGGKRSIEAFGSLTGRRADRLIIDDPHSVDTAESELERERAIIRFRESATSRLNDPITGAIVVIMQRLHQRDLSGTILSLGLPYVHIMLPMRFEADRRCVTPLGADPRTREGELLMPDRFPLEVVARDEAAMGSLATAGQYQQRPTPRGGLLFKRSHFRIIAAAPSGCRWVAGWDLAASESKSSAYTCRVLLGYQPRDRTYIIRHVVRDRVTNPEAMIINISAGDRQTVGKEQLQISMPQDPGAAGKIQARALVGALAGYEAFSSPESGDKYSRAQPVSAQAEAGNFAIVEGPWNGAFLDEVEVFPAGAFKDQIDALSRAFAHLLIRNGSDALPVFSFAPKSYYGEHPGD